MRCLLDTIIPMVLDNQFILLLHFLHGKIGIEGHFNTNQYSKFVLRLS